MSQNLISQDHEYVTCYTKHAFSTAKGVPKEYKSYRNPDNDPRGPWTFGDLTVGMDATMRPNQFYDLISPFTGKAYRANPNRVWAYIPESMKTKIEEGKVAFPDDPKLLALGIKITGPMLKRFKCELKSDVNPVSTLIDTGKGQDDIGSVVHLFAGLNTEATKEIQNTFGNSQFTYAKPMSLVSVLVDQFCPNNNDQALDFFAGSGTTGHAVINLNREDGGKRKYILVEMGDYFDTVLKPRIAKVVYSDSWKDGKPTARHTGVSHCFKYIRLESYEDTLNNLRLDDSPQRKKAVAANPALKEDYMLRYLLDVETRGSQSLLNIDAFADPTAYTLEVKKPGTDEYATRAVDLIETFNYLIGLRVLHSSVPQTFQATFKRITDPELPEDQHTKLVVDGRIRQDEGGPWWFRKIEGWVPKDAANPNNGQREKVLVVWRKLTDDIEQDNLMLDEWFQKNRISTRDFEFDTIYVNGSNNLPNLKQDDENWKVRLIEEEFMKRMWNGESI
jgi:adenine-specific DNA-methyltransferase